MIICKLILLKILGIIPARGGSKEIPLKNIQKIAGKPLIQYTIENATKSKFLNRVLVSTDNKKIASISKKLGADVPFLRPQKYSRDSSSLFDVVKHCIEYLQQNELYIPDIIVILQPTSPLRTSKMIDNAIQCLQKANATSIISVTNKRHHPFRSFSLKQKYLKPTEPQFEKYYQRQKLPLLYYPTGSVYAFWYNTFKKYNSMYGPRILPLISNEKEFQLDIDNLYDMFIAEMTLRNWNTWISKRIS